MFRFLAFLATLSILPACGTLSAARPMDAGQHRAGLTFGGPFTTALGPPIPIPSLVIEGRSGLEAVAGKPLDVNYGLNATVLAFGQLGLHGGASIHLLEGSGWRPGLSVTERLHLYNNYLDRTKPIETRMFWGLNELDFTLSWAVGNHLVYAGGSDILDLADPELLLSPFIGVEIQPPERRIGFQLESRLLGANFSPEVWDVGWLSVGEEPGTGLISVTLSAFWTLGREEEG